MNLNQYLQPTKFIDSNSDIIMERAHDVTQDSETLVDKAIALYLHARDVIHYSPFI